MTVPLLCPPLIAAVLAWRASRIPIRHRWRRREVRIMCEALCGRDRIQPPALIYARLRAMDALVSEELLLKNFERRGHRVIRNRRYTDDGSFGREEVIRGRGWLIDAKRCGSGARLEHVRAFATLSADQGAPGLFIHTGRTDPAGRACFAAWRSRDQIRTAATGHDHRRSARHRREAVVIAKPVTICAALAAVMIAPCIAQARGKSTVAEERMIAGCIYRSARGQLWLETALRGIRDQEGGWIGAKVRNRDGSYDLGPMQINSWWVPRFATLIGQSSVRVQRWLRQDACFNVEAARYILLNDLDRSGDIWIAIGRYHSPVRGRSGR